MKIDQTEVSSSKNRDEHSSSSSSSIHLLDSKNLLLLQKLQAHQAIERENVMARTRVMAGAKNDNITMDPDFLESKIH